MKQYLNKHMPIAVQQYKPYGLIGYKVTKATASDAPWDVLCLMEFEDAKRAKEVLADKEAQAGESNLTFGNWLRLNMHSGFGRYVELHKYLELASGRHIGRGGVCVILGWLYLPLGNASNLSHARTLFAIGSADRSVH